MTLDPTQLSWRDLIMLGFLLGLWWGSRSRREQGQRLGEVEKTVTEVKTLAEAVGLLKKKADQ